MIDHDDATEDHLVISSCFSDCIPAEMFYFHIPPMIPHSACWHDGLRSLAGLSSNPGLEGSFQLD